MRRFSFVLLLIFIILFSSVCVKQAIVTSSTTEINTDKKIQKEHYTKSINIIKNLLNRKNIESYIEKLEYLLEETLYQNKLHMSKDEFDIVRKKAMEKANKLIKKYDYKGATEILEPIKNLMIENDPSFIALYDTCVKFSKTVLYKGPVEHIFFHPLIAYPELAFDGDSSQQGFDNYMATVGEFKRTIEAFYKEDYVLIDIRLLYDVDEFGTVTKKDLVLPEGKKPLILSLDDYNFLKYMRKNGCVYGLTIDNNGTVVTFTNLDDGTTIYSDDNEVVPILENFIGNYPDFSYGGARGVIGLNGYEGSLGYPTDELDSPDYEKNLSQARLVADKIKEMGWLFACHSYSHYSPSKRTYGQMKYDTDKWIKEVGAVVGETDIYIYPFGEVIPSKDPKFQYMLKRGFKMFCGVQQKAYITYRGNFVLQTRRNIDGISLRNNHLSEIIDTSNIPDPVRPWYDDF